MLDIILDTIVFLESIWVGVVIIQLFTLSGPFKHLRPDELLNEKAENFDIPTEDLIRFMKGGCKKVIYDD